MTIDLCAQARDLLPAYSIGATNDDETRFVQSQITDCPDLVQELEEYRQLSDGLLRDVPQLTPPLHMLDNLMAAISSPPSQVVPPVAPSLQEPAATPILQSYPKPKRKLSDRTRWAYGLAAVLLLLLVGTNGYWLFQYGQLKTSSESLYAQYARLEAEQRTQTVSFDTMRAPDARWARMASPTMSDILPQATDPYAWIIWSPGRQEGVLLAQNFPPIEAGKVYQIWGTSNNNTLSLTTFRVDDKGQAILKMNAASWNFDRFWITTEPEGGSAQPSGDAFVRVRLNT